MFDEANKGAKVVNTSVSASSIWSSNNITRPYCLTTHYTIHSLGSFPCDGHSQHIKWRVGLDAS